MWYKHDPLVLTAREEDARKKNASIGESTHYIFTIVLSSSLSTLQIMAIFFKFQEDGYSLLSQRGFSFFMLPTEKTNSFSQRNMFYFPKPRKLQFIDPLFNKTTF